jgi:hypothetical protein
MADQADPTFVNTLKVHGFLNGVVNLAFSTAKWFPVTQGGETRVAVDEPITADLRMDLSTAIALRDALEVIIDANTKPPGPAN